MTENIPTYPGLAGKAAMVTGGSRGTGAATCRLLVANDARAAVHRRDEARIDTVVDEMGVCIVVF
jgi:3-oxoacyl-[acyl-carrier protein] reductase